VESIGKYQILSKIGQGGMGVVYKAKDPRIDRVVAVKTISARLDTDPELRERFRLEARSAAQINHKNVITIYDYDEADGVAYLVMEFLDGEDLKTKIGRRHSMPFEQKLHVMREVCEGLSHAHKMGVVHRDIKPGNIFVTATNAVKILDFGLARLVSSDLTRSGTAVGTPSYMSPEQLRGERVDQRSDIFSAGVVFYELLTSSNPFYGDSDFAISLKIVQEDPAPITALDSNVPQPVAAVVHRALQKDPSRRYQTLDELLDDLDRACAALEGVSARRREDVSVARDRNIDLETTVQMPGFGRPPAKPPSPFTEPSGPVSLESGPVPAVRSFPAAPSASAPTVPLVGFPLPSHRPVAPLQAEAPAAASKIQEIKRKGTALASPLRVALATFQQLIDIVVLLAIFGILAVFALEFFHSKKLDALWIVVKLHEVFDPRIAEAGTWFDVEWHRNSQSALPLGLVVLIVIVKAIFDRICGRIIETLANGREGRRR
jgi:serine/threonine protein kinase